MPSSLIDTPQALDAATAASLQSRRKKLLQIAEGKDIRIRIAYALAGCTALLALVAFFVADDSKAAASLATMFCISFGFTYLVGKASRKKAIDSLREMDQSN